jgi:hypothetical protein
MVFLRHLLFCWNQSVRLGLEGSHSGKTEFQISIIESIVKNYLPLLGAIGAGGSLHAEGLLYLLEV